jgi:hypothetical protein
MHILWFVWTANHKTQNSTLFFVISAILDRLGRENCQRVILIGHLRLNTLTRLNVSRLLGGVVGMQPHFFTVLRLD